MTEKEQIQNQIQELQEKLKKLEEQEPEMLLTRQGKVDFVNYKKNTYLRIEYEYSEFFPTVYAWYELEKFHLNLMPIKHLDLIDPLEELYHKEVVKQKEEYTYNVDETQKESVYHITDEHGETNPHEKHPNSVKMEELGFVKNSDGNWTARPLGETPQKRGERVHKEAEDFVSKNWYVDANVLLTPTSKPQTLYDICVKWKNADINPLVSDLIDAVEQWLPKEQSANSQNAYVESAVEGFNDCLQQIKSKLR